MAVEGFRVKEVGRSAGPTDASQPIAIGRRVTSGNARSFRIFCGIIKSERVSVVHFPKQDIGWKEIRCLVSGPVRETATVGSCETAHCSVHDVARELLGSSRVGKP